ncbi:unnamed protein product [Malus baccata var. baccata]
MQDPEEETKRRRREMPEEKDTKRPKSMTLATIPSLEDLLASTCSTRVALTPQQHENCAFALKFFKDKLRMPEQINREWDQLDAIYITQSEAEKRCTVALNTLNFCKNRYDDYVAFDENRVVLKSCAAGAGDYINASFITTPSSSSCFIATQGPLSHTFEAFWEMVIQYRCSVIVMLTDLDDNKCGDYFQADDKDGVSGIEFGNICVATKWIRGVGEFGDGNSDSLVLRLLEVKKNNNKEQSSDSDSEEPSPPMSVLHIQYPQWPDHGVPEDTFAVRGILKRVMYQVALAIPNCGPIVVHCSAGVGRTGTYCTIHDTLQRILSGDMSALDLVKTITAFRSQRDGMVQKPEQYRFCYEAVIDELEELILDGSPLGS